MKKVLFSLLFMAITAMSFSQGQGCPQINAAFVTEITPGIFQLTLNFSANGKKHINIAVYSGSVSPANLLIDTCLNIKGDGQISYTFPAPSVGTIVVLTSGTGGCNNSNSNSCTLTPPVTVIPGQGGPLPVVFENFFVSRNKSVVTLNWKTLSEINSKEFVIQKKTANGFVDVKTIPSSNQLNGSFYTTTDINTSKATTFYRIKMIDFDGSFRNSDTRTVKGIETEGGYIIFPNPTSANSKISISDISEPTDVQVIDNTGRIVKQLTLKNSNTLDLKDLRSGMYLVRIHPTSQSTVIIRKLTIVN